VIEVAVSSVVHLAVAFGMPDAGVTLATCLTDAACGKE
jgi:hypothetical protein